MAKKNRSVAGNTAERIRAQMTAQAAALLSEGSILASFQHKGVAGIEREEPVRRFLRAHLPNRFHVGQGSIASSEVILDAQHDITVSNRDTCFMLLNTIGAQLTTIESLHLIVEVRSDLGDIRSIAKSLMKVRELKPIEGILQTGPMSSVNETAVPVHTVIAYEGPSKENTMLKLKTANELQKSAEGRFPIDFILVLSTKGKCNPETGYLVGYSRKDDDGIEFAHHYYPHLDQTGMSGPKVISEGTDAFAYWYAAILHHLSGVTAYPPNLHAYLGNKTFVVPWKDHPY